MVYLGLKGFELAEMLYYLQNAKSGRDMSNQGIQKNKTAEASDLKKGLVGQHLRGKKPWYETRIKKWVEELKRGAEFLICFITL